MRGLLFALVHAGSAAWIGACNPDTSESTTGSNAVVVEQAMPTIPGAKILKPTTLMPNGRRWHKAVASWCIDAADPVVPVSAELTRTGWTRVESKLFEGHRRIAAQRGDLRFSATLSEHDDRCPKGTVVYAFVSEIIDEF